MTGKLVQNARSVPVITACPLCSLHAAVKNEVDISMELNWLPKSATKRTVVPRTESAILAIELGNKANVKKSCTEATITAAVLGEQIFISSPKRSGRL